MVEESEIGSKEGKRMRTRRGGWTGAFLLRKRQLTAAALNTATPTCVT